MFRPFALFCCTSIFGSSLATNLHDAILRRADRETLTRLAATDPNVQNDEKVSALNFALSIGNYDACEVLVNLGADVNSNDGGGYGRGPSPLHYAACANNTRMVNLLLEKGADANYEDGFGMSPLLTAAKHGYLEVAKALIFNNPRNNTDMFVKDSRNWDTCHYAAHGGHEGILDLMAYTEISMDLRNNENMRPLDICIVEGHLEASYVMINIINLNDDGNNTFLLAVKHGRKSVLLTMIKKIGNLLKSSDSDGNMALMWAVRVRENETYLEPMDDHIAACIKSAEIVKALILAGDDVEARNNEGENAAQIARKLKNYPAYAILTKAMEAEGSREQAKNLVPELRWELIEKMPDIESVQTMFQHVDKTDYLGRTAVHLAVETESFEIVKDFISKGCDLTVQNAIGNTVLHVVKSPGMARLLLDACPILANIPNDTRDLPLHMSVVSDGNEDLVNVLAPATSDIRAKNTQGMKALDIAAQRGNVKITACLLNHGAENEHDLKLDKHSSLFFAITAKANEEVVNLFLKESWRHTAPTSYGLLPAHFGIIYSRDIDLIRRLLQGVKPDHVSNFGSFLHWTVFFYQGEAPDTTVLKYLVEEFRVPLNLINYNGRTALHISSERRLVDAIRLLVQHGADVSLTTPSGGTALHAVCERFQVESAAILMHANRDILALRDSNGLTPVDFLWTYPINPFGKYIIAALELTPEDIPRSKLKTALRIMSKSFVGFIDRIMSKSSADFFPVFLKKSWKVHRSTKPCNFQDFVGAGIAHFKYDNEIYDEDAVNVGEYPFKELGTFYALVAAYYPELASAEFIEETNDIIEKEEEYRNAVKAFEKANKKHVYINKLHNMTLESYLDEDGLKLYGGTYLDYMSVEFIDMLLITINNGNVWGRMELVANSLMITMKKREGFESYHYSLWEHMNRLSELVIPKSTYRNAVN